jgi:uncharacterized protein involved in outer membrane biogenesis
MRKLILIVMAVVVGLIVVAIGGLYWFLSGDGMRLALEQQATMWLGQPVRVGGARGQIFPRIGIHLGDVRVGEPVRLTLSDVQVSTDLRALLSRRIENARLVISDSRIEMPLPFELPESESASPAEDASRAMEVVSIQEIALRDIRIISRGREVVVSADSTLDGNRLTLRRFTAESGATSLQVEGEVDLEPRVDAKLRAKANKIDLDELLALADAFTPERSATARRSAAPTARIAARVSAETATAGGIEVKQFATDMQVDGDRVALSPLTFQLFGGRYQGSLNARLGDRLAVTLQSRLQDLDVAQLAAFGGSPDTITGKLTGAGTFSAQGADMGAILSTASGKGTASIVDGTIRRLNLIRTVVLFFGRPAPDSAPGSDRFNRIDASFSLARQVFRAESFALQSPDADIVGTGTLTLGTKALDGTLDVSLSEEQSAQAGTDLARYTREGNRIVLPARLGGTLEQPRIAIDASAAIKRGLSNDRGDG